MQDYIEQERENFEKNKETLKIQAEEHIFAQLPKEKQKELIEKGYFDENGKRVKTKFASHEEYRDWYCSVYGHNVRFESHFTREQEEVFDKKAREELERGYNKYGVWKTKKALPLLKTLWGQSGDYNDKVNVVCGNDQAPVGCVATAVGQIMAFHKKPAIFKGREMHWEEMTKVDAGHMFSNIYSKSVRWNSTAVEDIQHLLARLGDSDLLDMDYGCITDGGSGAYDTNALRTLHKMGYSADLIDYSVPTLIDNIKNNQPIYISGSSTKTTYTTGWWLWKKERIKYEDGHAWVVDGYVFKERPVTTCYVLTCRDDEGEASYEVHKRQTLELVHNNFGWGGSLKGDAIKVGEYDGTGWYNIGIFNAKFRRQAGSNVYKSDIKGDFKYSIKLIINIK